MSITGFVRSKWRRVALSCLGWRLARQAMRMSLEPGDWPHSLLDPTSFYFECLRYFHQRLPQELKAHRAYFMKWGFGEHQFHVMSYLISQDFTQAQSMRHWCPMRS